MAQITIPGLLPDGFTLENNLPIGVSQLGTIVYDDVTFSPVDNPTFYTEQDSDIPILIKEVRLQAVAISCQRSKNIVETNVAGRDGSIKQFMSRTDYSVTITAKINERLDFFPFGQLRAIYELENAPVKVNISSKFLNIIHKIDSLVIMDIDTSPEQGSSNEANVTLTCKTDYDFKPSDYLIKNETYN